MPVKLTTLAPKKIELKKEFQKNKKQKTLKTYVFPINYYLLFGSIPELSDSMPMCSLVFP